MLLSLSLFHGIYIFPDKREIVLLYYTLSAIFFLLDFIETLV